MGRIATIARNRMIRKRERNGLYRSSQVARIFGITPRTLYRMLANGRISEPMRNPENRYRVWTDVDLQGIREALQK
jgi:DNA-binding transcriptional MerR regulator